MFDDRMESCEPLDFERLCIRVDRNDLAKLAERYSALGFAARLIAKQV